MSTVVCWFQRTLKQLEREQTDTQTDRHTPTHTHTHKTTTVTLAHARRGLIRQQWFLQNLSLFILIHSCTLVVSCCMYICTMKLWYIVMPHHEKQSSMAHKLPFVMLYCASHYQGRSKEALEKRHSTNLSATLL